ncbi:MAG: undecaprenyl/decaprenyl-phosphate alpha-N-acetylglucosaminyl 1-phosphate transferase [Ruminococcaceae bacterium]|nr:undecaprenyl/decaprenyl-phosphate alpha-N-acetylglucosaminyl 1-phosphate transferase [Oscillospiraceae bacterium]
METINILYNIVAVVFAALIAFTLTPPTRVLAFKIGAVDVPLDNRRMHTKPIPRIGGLAIFLSFWISTMLFCSLTPELASIWVGGGILVILGVLDDIYRLKPGLKFVVQLLAAVFAVVNGCVIDHINIGGEYIMLGVFSYPLTLLWIVGLTNAINFIDGLDGLACGVSLISSISLFCVLLLQGDSEFAVITAILAGACLGFLPFNSNPARIFMGDTGALFLGYALAVISVQGVFKLHAVLSFIAPLMVFAFPILDTFFAIFRRLLAGKSPFAPDRGHLHHRLVDMGFTQKESVNILYAICGILGLVAVFCTESMFANGRAIRSFCVAGIALLIFLVNFVVMKNPDTRKHSGLTEDDVTVEEYLRIKEAERAKRIAKKQESGKNDAVTEQNDEKE